MNRILILGIPLIFKTEEDESYVISFKKKGLEKSMAVATIIAELLGKENHRGSRVGGNTYHIYTSVKSFDDLIRDLRQPIVIHR
ncbi:MAG: hypothetical protein AAB847_03040 [Patescibacteria group bacterium]